MWRPDNWNNPLNENYSTHDIYEEGADAMLKAILDGHSIRGEAKWERLRGGVFQFVFHYSSEQGDSNAGRIILSMPLPEGNYYMLSGFIPDRE